MNTRPELPMSLWRNICRVANYRPGFNLPGDLKPHNSSATPTDEELARALVVVGQRAHSAVSRNTGGGYLAYEADAIIVWQSVPQELNDYLDAKASAGELFSTTKG